MKKRIVVLGLIALMLAGGLVFTSCDFSCKCTYGGNACGNGTRGECAAWVDSGNGGGDSYKKTGKACNCE